MTHAPHVAYSVRGVLATARCELQKAAQYRVNMAVWGCANVLQIIVYMSVWRAVAEAGGGSAGGFTASEFAGYFLVLLLVREMTMTWMPYEFAGYVRTGQLAILMLRPLHPVLTIGSAIISYRLQMSIITVPSAIILFWWFDAQVDTSLAAVGAALLVLPLASTVRFLADTLCGLTALWLVRIDGIRGIYYLLLLLLGGQFAPLGVLPEWLQVVAKALPFYWTLGYPTELLIGRADPAEAWIGLLVLSAWTLGLYAIFQPVWRRGARAFESVGQ